MVWSRDFVHGDLVVSPDETRVHRTTGAGWHGFVGTRTFRTGVHTFRIDTSGYWAIGVVDANANFRTKTSRWCAMNLAWDGTYGMSKNAADDVTTNEYSMEGWDKTKAVLAYTFQMKVDMVAHKLAFRDSEYYDWKELSHIVLPCSLCLWASLGSKNSRLAVTATCMHPSGFETTLARGISVFCCSEKHADICIVVGDARFPAHSFILAARSPAFAAMLTDSMKDSIIKEIVLEDIEACVVKDLLQFVYSGCLDASCEHTRLAALLGPAKRFGISVLEKLVLERLCTDGFRCLLQVSCRL